MIRPLLILLADTPQRPIAAHLRGLAAVGDAVGAGRRRERPPIGLTGLAWRRTTVVMKRRRKKAAKHARPERYPEKPETVVSRTPRRGKVPRWVMAGPDEG